MAKRKSGRTLKRPESLRFILLTGTPGTGKTTLGNYLQERHGFKHLNFEGAQLTRYLPDGVTLDVARVQALKKEGRDVAITWGFVPETQLAAVLALRDLGFRWIWFDGNRDAARRAFNARGDVEEHLLDTQLARINTHLDLAELGPEIINTFDANGEFRSLEDIASELLR